MNIPIPPGLGRVAFLLDAGQSKIKRGIGGGNPRLQARDTVPAGIGGLVELAAGGIDLALRVRVFLFKLGDLIFENRNPGMGPFVGPR